MQKQPREIPPPTELEDVIPELYLGFWDVFSRESFDELPEQKQWDHAINLIPGSKPFSTKVYPVSPEIGRASCRERVFNWV